MAGQVDKTTCERVFGHEYDFAEVTVKHAGVSTNRYRATKRSTKDAVLGISWGSLLSELHRRKKMAARHRDEMRKFM